MEPNSSEICLRSSCCEFHQGQLLFFMNLSYKKCEGIFGMSYRFLDAIASSNRYPCGEWWWTGISICTFATSWEATKNLGVSPTENLGLFSNTNKKISIPPSLQQFISQKCTFLRNHKCKLNRVIFMYCLPSQTHNHPE